MHKFALAACAGLSLAACSSVDSVQLTADLRSEVQGAPHGFIYYEPAAFLIITQLPVAPQAPSGSGGPGGSGAAANLASPGGSDKTSEASPSQPQTAAPASSSSDTSFSATMASYSVKILYLKDLAHPHALRIKTGWLGATSASPTFQDGWMLTSLNGQSDSGVASTLAALAGLLGPGASKAVGGAKSVSGAATATMASTLAGKLTPEQRTQLQALIDLTKQDASTSLPHWGNGVLPPGIYRLDALTSANPEITPVLYFCKTGVQNTSCPGES